MHPHCPAVPWMPRMADFTDVSNMGVVLLTCTMLDAITKASVPADQPSDGDSCLDGRHRAARASRRTAELLLPPCGVIKGL